MCRLGHEVPLPARLLDLVCPEGISSICMDYCPSAFGFANPPVSPSFSLSAKSGLGISTPSVVLPYVIPPSLLIGLKIAGSMMFFSSLIASSLTQNLTPSTIANTPVFFPGVALDSNSCVENSFPSMEKMASLTRLGFTSLDGAGVRPVSAHSLMP